MERIELDVSYTNADLASAAITYRKFVGIPKRTIIFSWVLVVFVFAYFLPAILIPLACLPFGTCTSSGLWQWARIVIATIICCILVPLVVHSDIIYQIRVGMAYQKYKNLFQETKKFIIDKDGLELRESSSTTAYNWHSFRQILEGKVAFLLVLERNQYIIIPKRIFKNQDDITKFSQAITTWINSQQP